VEPTCCVAPSAPIFYSESEQAMTVHRKALIAVASSILACTLGSAEANAFWGHHRRPAVAYSPVVMPTYAAAPIVVGRPAFAPAPVVVGYAPAAPLVYPAAPAAYAAPTTSYYAPAATVAPATYAAPTTSYYAPSPVVAPTTTFYPPAPVIAPAPVILVPWRNY
jgi:hypothetical protein